MSASMYICVIYILLFWNTIIYVVFQLSKKARLSKHRPQLSCSKDSDITKCHTPATGETMPLLSLVMTLRFQGLSQRPA